MPETTPKTINLFNRLPYSPVSECEDQDGCHGNGYREIEKEVRGKMRPYTSTCSCPFGRYQVGQFSSASSGVPSDAFRWEPLDITSPGLLEIAQKVEKYGESFSEASGSILMLGVPGTGKTRLAKALAAYLQESFFRVRWHNWPKFLSRLRASYDSNSDQSELDIIQEAIDCHVLFLDDIGAESMGNNPAWGQEKLFLLLNEAIETGGCKLVLTTNLDGKGLSELYHERVLDRIRRLCRPATGGDYLEFRNVERYKGRNGN